MDMSKCPFAYNGLVVSELQKWTFGHVHFDVHSALNIIVRQRADLVFRLFVPALYARSSAFVVTTLSQHSHNIPTTSKAYAEPI